VCDDIAAFIASLGWRTGPVVASAIRGGDGNQEFFVEAQRG
jgi:predicted rRNA methylase YqxC with S4 and FtsJ domains